MTECTQSSFEVQAHFSREVVARFDGGTIDAAAVLLRETNRQLNLLPRLPACFEGRRQPWLISYTVQVMAVQRAYAPAVGYGDLSYHDQLREGPAIRYREEAIDEVLTNQPQSLAQPKSRSPESV
jgi:hypothetical protein